MGNPGTSFRHIQAMFEISIDVDVIVIELFFRSNGFHIVMITLVNCNWLSFSVSSGDGKSYSDSGFESEARSNSTTPTSTNFSSGRMMPPPSSVSNLHQQNGFSRTSPVNSKFSPPTLTSFPAASTSTSWSRTPQQPPGGILPTQNIEDDSTYFDDEYDEPATDLNASQSRKGKSS